jgi:glycosyltransferase involved in cell wall biosynthesis
MHSEKILEKPVNKNHKIDISAVITFHSEGVLAHRTLLGIERVRKYANRHNIAVDLLLVLDMADDETMRVVCSSPVLREIDQILIVKNADLGASRNSGIAASQADFIGIFDGDDYFSENWLVGALNTVKSKEGEVVVHPDYVISFGAINAVAQILDMDRTPDYPLANCFSVHPWVSSSFARRQIYLNHPYHRADTQETGFGFEDWHWNLELLAAAVRHVSAPNTALFYRRKASSMLVNQLGNKAIIRPSQFFNAPENWSIELPHPSQCGLSPAGGAL